MTRARTWPNNAAYARDQAVMEATQAIRELTPVIRGEKNFLTVLASTIDHLYKIIQLLNSVR